MSSSAHTSAHAAAAAAASSAAADPPELRAATATAPDHAASADPLRVNSASAPPGCDLAAGPERENSARSLGCCDAAQPSAATSGHGSATATGSSSPAANRLHRHALECIFAFLSLRELASALQVARDWTDAVGSMRRMDLAVERPTAPPSELARSLVGRHVGRMGGHCYTVRLSGADLSVLTERMAHLRELHCLVELPLATAPLLFPAQLRLLLIHLTQCAVSDAALVNAAIAAIGRLALLEDLFILLSAMDSQFSFAPLAALPQLRQVTIWWPVDGAQLSDAQIDQLRALTHLQTLTLEMTVDLMRRLLHQPHQLQWQQLRLPHPLDDEAAALLQLPSLTKIGSFWTACNRFDWLRGLPNLTDVRLLFLEEVGAAGRIESLVAGLAHCANIEILKLQDCHDVTAAHLAELLPRLPRLRELTLVGLRIDSLAFLSQAPLTIQLSVLQLSTCRQLPVTELRHVHALRGLHTLQLVESFDAPLEPDERSLLTPPSAVLPQLTEFEYS